MDHSGGSHGKRATADAYGALLGCDFYSTVIFAPPWFCGILLRLEALPWRGLARSWKEAFLRT